MKVTKAVASSTLPRHGGKHAGYPTPLNKTGRPGTSGNRPCAKPLGRVGREAGGRGEGARGSKGGFI